jgi:hypothetical protein
MNTKIVVQRLVNVVHSRAKPRVIEIKALLALVSADLF